LLFAADTLNNVSYPKKTCNALAPEVARSFHDAARAIP
jgi:hypothetical protein